MNEENVKSEAKTKVILSLIAIIVVLSPIIIVVMSYASGYRTGYDKGLADGRNHDSSPMEVSVVSESEDVLRGVDISSYQKKSYKKLIDDYADDFVICKATDGTDVDQTCDKAYQYAKSKGKLLGIYFFGYPKLHDAKKYAQFCASTVEGYIGEAIFILDCERHPTIKWISAWVKEFERLTGVKPLVYANLNGTETLDWTPVIENGNPLWLAYYYADDGEYYNIPHEVGKWPTDQILLHQYTTAGLGESESLDLDVFFGDKNDWRELAKVNK